MEKFVKVIKALSDPNRVKIIKIFTEKNDVFFARCKALLQFNRSVVISL
ncbi:MAG: hypothetical protein SRB2_01119 [Desulfobacteraceae bacterium Eth-SRB2]|nr:MAG: hypothetical protein SRB2_01119 [Desulfobacteraceae bacterium Eth-SRB2]